MQQTNDYFLSIPSYNIETILKFELEKTVTSFKHHESGCLYDGKYYDFKYVKLTYNNDLLDTKEDSNKIVAYCDVVITNIDINTPIFLAVIHKYSIDCYILSDIFYYTMWNDNKLQCSGISHCLHIPYHVFITYAKFITSVQLSLKIV